MQQLIAVHRKKIILFFVFLISSIFLSFFLPGSLSENQKQVLLIFFFAVYFWVFEMIPLYATSLSVVLLLTFFLTGLDEGIREGYHLYLVPFSSPVIMLFLGGFVLAAALKKHQIDLFLSQKILARLSNSYHILFSYLFLSAFFSMWISNTAACAMMLILIKPILSILKEEDPFRKSLPLAIAFGANIGGIGTPIGTPPNAIAIGILQDYGVYLDFFSWMVMAIPLALAILFITGAVLLFFFPPSEKKLSVPVEQKKSLSCSAIYVLCIAFIIIGFWLTASIHHIPEGIVALFGVAIFAAFGLIDHEDLKKIDWDILILMWGGLALGQGIQLSKLMDPLLKYPLFQEYSFLLIAAFCLLAFGLSSFISNTATANILLPIAVTLTGKNPILLSITVALCCSFALVFPISTPPNAMAYSLRTFKTNDMFKSGAIISIIAIILVLVGFEYFISKSFSI